MANEPGEWVQKDAYVMPLLPPSLKIDPVLAALLHVTAFLELSGDEAVHPDWAVEAMEHVSHYLEHLSAERVKDFQQQVRRVAEYARKNKWGREVVEYFTEYLQNFGVAQEGL